VKRRDPVAGAAGEPPGERVLGAAAGAVALLAVLPFAEPPLAELRFADGATWERLAVVAAAVAPWAALVVALSVAVVVVCPPAAWGLSPA
jgi:hypothetical protein